MSTYNVKDLEDLKRDMVLTSQRIKSQKNGQHKQQDPGTSIKKNKPEPFGIPNHSAVSCSKMNANVSVQSRSSKPSRNNSKFRRKLIQRPVGYTWNRYLMFIYFV